VSLFEPNFTTILKHLNSGDFGIARRLYSETRKIILDAITDKTIKKQFEDLSEFPYGTGNWAIERTTLQSLMEAQKASVLMSLNYLKIFGQLEYVARKFSSGPNPEVDPNSYIATSRRLSKNLPVEYQGSFTEIDPGRMPENILLGKYHENGAAIEPSTEEKSGKVWIGQWPQYRSFEQYETEQLNDIKTRLQNFNDQQFKERLITEREKNLRNEYNEIEREAQLKRNPGGIRTGLRKPFRPESVTNQDDKVVIVNIEDDYDIEVTELEVEEVRETDNGTTTVTVKHHLINATLKSDLRADTDILIREDGTKKYEPSTLSGNLYVGTYNYIIRLLPVLLEDGINTLVGTAEWIADTNRITGDIISKRIANEFEFMDPGIAKRGDNDELKVQYYSEGEMIFNGSTKVSQGNIDLVFTVRDVIPEYEVRGTLVENDPQMTYAKTILLFQSLTMNMYTELLETYKDFLVKVMNPFTLPSVYTEFQTMNWLKSSVTKNKLLSRLGSTDNTIYTTDLFENVARNWDREITEKNMKFYEELINKYIEQVSAVYNFNLPKISL
jgi:hypothetical protein